MPGAAGAIAVKHLATTKADGLTIGLLSETSAADLIESNLLGRFDILGSPGPPPQIVLFTGRSGITTVEAWRRAPKPPAVRQQRITDASLCRAVDRGSGAGFADSDGVGLCEQRRGPPGGRRRRARRRMYEPRCVPHVVPVGRRARRASILDGPDSGTRRARCDVDRRRCARARVARDGHLHDGAPGSLLRRPPRHSGS